MQVYENRLISEITQKISQLIDAREHIEEYEDIDHYIQVFLTGLQNHLKNSIDNHSENEYNKFLRNQIKLLTLTEA